jgi:hypothetical protein
VAIWPEQLGTVQFMEGIDMNKLAAAFKNLTGRDLPVTPTPQPTPIPTPTPPPTPTPTPQGCLPSLLQMFTGKPKK